MEFIYVLISDYHEWEDLRVYTTKEEAITASKNYPSMRVEVFKSSPKGFIPTYNFYVNGALRGTS